MNVANRETTMLADRAGAFVVIKRGNKNTRVAPLKDLKNSFVVPNTLLVDSSSPVPAGITVSPDGEEQENAAGEIEDSFAMLAELTECVARKFSNGIFVTGPGGTGKTWTVMDVIKNTCNMVEGQDYIVIKGYSTAAAMYNLMFHNKDKLVVLDDCDSLFSDATGLNVLKAVLDTYAVRTVSWNTNSPLIAAPSFDFTGQIIFISNMDPDKAKAHLEALRTRVLTVHIAGTPEQMRDRCCNLIPILAPNLTPGEQAELSDFIRANYRRIKTLSLRWAVNLVSIRRFKPLGWQNLALRMH